MSKLKTIVVSGAILASLGLSTGALLMAWINRPVPPPVTKLAPADLQSVAGVKPDAAKNDRVVSLASAVKGGNAKVSWICGKSTLGGARAEEHFGSWETIGGAVAYNAKAQQLLGLEIKFAADSLTSDVNVLTNTVLQDQDWFEKDKFPEASFTASVFTPRTAENEKELGAVKAPDGWTHLIRGTFTLHGISQEMAVPAKVSFTDSSTKIEAACLISRAAFKIDRHKFSASAVGAGAFTVDDAVSIRADIVAAPDVATLVSELTKQVQVQQNDLKMLDEARKAEGKELTNRLIKLETALEDAKAELKKALAAGPQAHAAAPVDLASLPKEFEDEVVLPAVEKDYEMKVKDPKTGEEKLEKRHLSYSGMKTPFKMILVPGDKAKGIAPFYIGETEVTWDMFHDWSHWYDATPLEAEKECKELGLRPSNADSYTDTSHNDKRYNGYPALGMTRKNAEAFCALLSKQTGRTYRLPTEAEWDLAYALGGGDPATDEGKLEAAWCKENAEETPDSRLPAPGMCQLKTPNNLGLYDMLGNVAEWVKTSGAADADGKNTFVRGGDFMTPVAQLSGKLREESDNRKGPKESWNATYPNDPISKWWYKDHYQVGFRLVCEPTNLPVKK